MSLNFAYLCTLIRNAQNEIQRSASDGTSTLRLEHSSGMTSLAISNTMRAAS